MFQHDQGAPVIRRRMGFFSVTIMSLSAVIITAIVCASGLGLYSLGIIDAKADSVTGLVEETLRQLPELRAALPPVLADAWDDVRSPEYLSNVAIMVHPSQTSDRYGRRRAVVKVENTGDRVISLLSMRIVGVDEAGDPVSECNTWAATPIQADEDEWRGPLMPHETRKFIVRYYCDDAGVDYEHEVTELRVWQPGGVDDAPETDTATTAVVDRGIGL